MQAAIPGLHQSALGRPGTPLPPLARAVSVRTTDRGPRETVREKKTFAHAYKAERFYSVQLRKVARMVGDLTRAFHPFDQVSRARLTEALHAYSKTLRPW